MRVSSAKAKGRRLQQKVRDALLEGRPDLHPDDIRSTAMGQNGEDILFSPAARKVYPYSVECKCVEKLNIWEAINQARENAGQHTPIVAFSRNNEDTWVAMPMSKFIELHKDKNETAIKP
jgi:hypothetical protein